MLTVRHLIETGIVVLVVLGSRVYGAGPQEWGTLRPGPFAVGFKSSWRLDWSRAYDRVFADKTTYASGKAPRPILINLWYPAKQPESLKAMPHRGYLEINSTDPHFLKLADELIGYERDVVWRLRNA